MEGGLGLLGWGFIFFNKVVIEKMLVDKCLKEVRERVL